VVRRERSRSRHSTARGKARRDHVCGTGQVRSARELMGQDVVCDEPFPTHASENRDWVDSADPVASDDADAWVNDDGSLHLPKLDNQTPSAAQARAHAQRFAANRQIEQQALQYMSRKWTPAERLAVTFSSEDARTRLAALRNLSCLADEMQVHDERQHAQECARRKTQTRSQRLRAQEREAEIKVLRTEMFQMGYHWDRYMTKEEALEALDRRDADPLYQHFVQVLVPLGLQHFNGPDATQSSWDILHKIYPDKPRKGGIDPRLVYDGDPRAALKVMRTRGRAARHDAHTA